MAIPHNHNSNTQILYNGPSANALRTKRCFNNSFIDELMINGATFVYLGAGSVSGHVTAQERLKSFQQLLLLG